MQNVGAEPLSRCAAIFHSRHTSKLVAAFQVSGFPPVPWTVPDICHTAKKGKKWRFAKRGKKTNWSKRTLSLFDWQREIKRSLRFVWGGKSRLTEPVHLRIYFFRRHDDESLHGTVCGGTMHWSEEKFEYVKDNHHEPDATNLLKGAEDALKGDDGILEDDVVVRWGEAICLWGSSDGCLIEVSKIISNDATPEESSTL
jgi:Holliday junction resolvase RusA-like endonuclease